MASKIAQDIPTWLKVADDMPPRGSKTAPGRLQVAKELPKEAPERPKSFKHQKEIIVFGLLAFSLLMGFRGLRMGPRSPERAPRGVKKASKTAPKPPQERPKTALIGNWPGSDGARRSSCSSAITLILYEIIEKLLKSHQPFRA